MTAYAKGRGLIHKGDKTSTGGVVTQGVGSVMLVGEGVTQVGMIATCRKCKKGWGHIVAIEKWDVFVANVQVALDKDVVMCDCVAGSNTVISSAGAMRFTKLDGKIHGFKPHTSRAEMESAYQTMADSIAGRCADIPTSSTEQQNFGVNDEPIPSSHATTTENRKYQLNPNNAYWPPYNPLAKNGGKTLNVEYVNPMESIAWMSPEEAHEFLKNLYEDIGYKQTLSNMKDYGLGLGKGTYDAVETARGLGSLGVQAYTKTINGQDWIIIKNYRKHLKTLERGHKWKANNPRIIQLGLGLNDLKGAVRFVRFNVGLEIAVSIGINAVDYALRDEATLAGFVGSSAGDIVKGILSISAGATVTAAFAAPVATIMGTTLFFVGASFFFGQALNIVDKEIGFSEYLVDKAKGLYE